MIKGSSQITLVDMTDGYTIFLSSEAISLSGETATLGSEQNYTVNVTAFSGSDQVLPVVGLPTCPANVTASVGAASDNTVPVTITFASSLASAGKVTIPVTVGGITFNKDVTFSISFKGEGGGSSSYSYRMITSHAAIGKTDSGYNPTYITLTSKRTLGTSGPTNYAGRFVIETTTDNTNWTVDYTSTQNETTKSYTIPANIIAVRCSLYMAGGTTTLLDQQTIPIVSDGADAYTVVLSNESHTFAGTRNGAYNATAETMIAAFKGGTQVATTIGTITGAPTGMTTAVSGNGTTAAKVTITVTSAMTTVNGTLTIPITADGKQFEKQLSFSLAIAGDDGIVLAITTSAGNIFKNYTQSTVLTAHAYQSGAEISTTGIGTLTWFKDGTQVDTGATLTVSASDISSKSVYEVRLIDDGSIVSCNTITVSIQQDIVSSTRFYQLVDQTDPAPSKPTTMTPSGWTTTEPTYVEGSVKKLYTVDRTVFSTNTFQYSDVSLSSSYEAAKAAYNLAIAAQTTANAKNSVLYQTSAPTGTHKINDIWYDTDAGNAMYCWNGSAWALKAFGTTAISDNAITAPKLYVSSLSAITADMGTLTSGQVRVETFIGQDRYVGRLYTSPGADAAYGVRILEVIKDVGNTGDLHSQFFVRTDGLLYALNADIKGKISASSGDIGGWDILTNRIESDKTGSSGYRSGMQCLPDGSGTAFYAGCTTPAGGTIGGNAAFYVTHAGYLYSQNANIEGTIKATSGTIGGFVIGANRLTATSGGLTTGLQTPANGAHAIAVGATAENDWSSAPFRVTHAGAVTATALTASDAHFSGCIVDDTLYFGTSSTKSGISGNSGTLYLNAAYAGGSPTQVGNAIQAYGTITGYGRYVHMSYAIGSGEQARFRLTNTTSQASGVTAGCVQLSSTGAFGLYNITNSRWLIYDNGTVTMPSETTVSGLMTFSTAPILRNARYLTAYDNTNSPVKIIGISSSGRLYLGPLADDPVWPDRTVIANEIGSIYVYNYSGTQILLSTAVSDRRQKHDIEDLDNAHDFIMGLEPKKFKLNGESGDRYHFGFIAQDVRPVLEKTVGDGVLLAYNPTDPDSDDCDTSDDETFVYSMDYTQYIAPHIAVTQQHERRIADLEAEIAALKELIRGKTNG